MIPKKINHINCVLIMSLIKLGVVEYLVDVFESGCKAVCFVLEGSEKRVV